MTNAYCDSLATLRAAPTHYLKDVGDQWRSPDLLFWGINAVFGPLVLDLFADDSNAKCPAWYTAEDNALTQDWSERLAELEGAAFANPPYSRSQYVDKQAISGMRHIMAHTMAMRELGGRYVFLIKAATSETWWPEEADHIAFIRGRIGFDLPAWFVPADARQQPTGAFFAGAVVIFDKTWRGERFSYIQRSDLEAKGRAFMSLAQFAAGKQPQQSVDNARKSVVETEIPLQQSVILEQSGIKAWACVVAAFGDKAEYTFAESKYGHTWAADSVEKPEITPVHHDVIAKAQSLIAHQTALTVLADWLKKEEFASDAARAETVGRMSAVFKELADECGLKVMDFIATVNTLDKSSWFNSRMIRTHIRKCLASAAERKPESRIWPLEVGLVFSQVEGASDLNVSQQNKLKANINQLWLERMPTSEIITVAGGLVSSMREVASA
ncbi:phage N-6-adenine-methyltransferase [Erwinia amylovora]|uniref:phage N-6-adenine-methyltransferase n=1 Tax=Erwinia amylovora TaxID=552 RepID=UPI0014438FB7|nr:phage N-6-adenine-methyltransferase [Erwinia amylovora]